MSLPVVLSIAGSDCSGGAGIQADIKTITMHGCFAETVITALTAQNTTGVFGVVETSPEFVGKQIDAVFTDIRPDAVKIGMVGSPAIVEVIAERLAFYKATNIVVDPVMVSTSGSALMAEDAVGKVVDNLFPLATVITPNIPEAEILTHMSIGDHETMLQAARRLAEMTDASILLKGGHSVSDADDLFLTPHRREVWLPHKRIETDDTHGTGCTLSSAIACGLALDKEPQASVAEAKQYISGALKNNPHLGEGNGPLNHMWNMG